MSCDVGMGARAVAVCWGKARFKAWLTGTPYYQPWNDQRGYWVTPSDFPRAPAGSQLRIGVEDRPELGSARGTLWVTRNETDDEMGEVLNIDVFYKGSTTVLGPKNEWVGCTGYTRDEYPYQGKRLVPNDPCRSEGYWVCLPPHTLPGNPSLRREDGQVTPEGYTGEMQGQPVAKENAQLLEMLAKYDVLEVVIYAHGGRPVPRMVEGGISDVIIQQRRLLFDIRHYKEAVRQIQWPYNSA